MVGLATALPQFEPVSFPYIRSPSFLAVVGVAGVVTLLLYTEHPRVSRRAVVSLVPWMVVGATLSVLAIVAEYPPLLRPAVAAPGAYLTVYIVVALVWFVSLQLTRGARGDGKLPIYLCAMGLGATVVVVGALLVHTGEITATQLFWLAIAPIAAAAIAGIVLLLMGLWYPEAAAYTGMAGGLVVFGHALAAIGTAVAVVADGSHTALSRAVLDLVATAGVAGLAGLDQPLLWVWGYVWAKLVLAIVVIVALTAYTRRHPARGNLLLGLVAAVGVVGGVTALLTTVVGL